MRATLRIEQKNAALTRDNAGEPSQSALARPTARPNRPASDHQKKQSAADLLPNVTLPKGGGAIRGIGERFSVSPPTGTTSMSVPLPLSL